MYSRTSMTRTQVSGFEQDPEKPNGVHQIKPNIIIRYLALHIDCVLYVYLCNGLKFLEISESEYAKSKNIIHE